MMSDGTYLYFDLTTGNILNTVDFNRYNYADEMPESQLFPISAESYDFYVGEENKYMISPPNIETGEIVVRPEEPYYPWTPTE